MQLETTALADSQNTPPPTTDIPLVKANPDRLALSVRYTHRFVPPPVIVVSCGPLTLRMLSGLSTFARS